MKKNRQISEELYSKQDGEWYRYKQGGNFYPTSYPFGSSETQPWYEEQCKEELKNGDMYIYRVKQYITEEIYEISDVIYRQPVFHYYNKIFIKMKDQTEVSEISLSGPDSDIGDDLLDILEKKLEEFDNKNGFDRKIRDMRLLNLVDKKTQQDVPLTIEELRFLYEIDNKIEGIYFNKEHLIANIIDKRKSVAEDMNRIYDFRRISEYLDDLDLDILKDATGLKLPKITGNLSLSGLEKTKGLELPEIVKGNLEVAGVTESSRVVFPKIVEGDLSIHGILTHYDIPPLAELENNSLPPKQVVSAKQLTLPNVVKGDLFINVTLKDFEYLKLPEIGGLLSIDHSEKAKGLILPEVTNDLFLVSLTSAEGVLFPEKTKGWLHLFNLKDVNGLILPKNMKGKIDCKLNIPDSCFMEDDDYKKYRQNLLYRLKATKEICKEYNVSEDEIAFTVNECKQKKGQIKILKDDVNLNKVLDNGDLNVLPEIIIGDVNLKEKTYLNNFTFKSNVVGNLNFSGLVSAKKVILSDGVRGSVSLSNLTEVKELVLPRIIEKNLIMNKLKEINGNVIFSKMIGGTVDLSSLVSVESVNFSETIQGDLKLLALEYINNSSLPKFVGKSFIMSSLKKTTSLILPKMVGEGVFLSSLSEFDYLELPQAINGSLSLEGLKSADGLIFPEVVTKSVYLNNLKSLTNSKLPRVVGRHLNMENLLEINNSQLPSIINGDLLLRRLKTTDKLSLPSIINGDVELGSLTDIDTLILSKYIGGDLNLCSLKNAREVVFPEVINKETWLGNFDKEDVKLPASLKEKILTKNVPYDCFIADDEYKEYRSARVEELNTIKPPENVSKIKKLTRRLTDHS